MKLPTIKDLQPLYDAADSYGQADLAVYERWLKLKGELGCHEKAHNHPDVVNLEKIKDSKYELMDGALTKINNKFPNLNLMYPGGHVGRFGGKDGINSYIEYANRHIIDYALAGWEAENIAFVKKIREKVRATKIASIDNVCVGQHLVTKNAIVRVVSMTPSRRKIKGKSLIDDKATIDINPKAEQFKIVSHVLAGQLVKFYNSRLAHLNAHGLKVAV